ncbi:MAG: xanthine dehydrogenase family protein molybdopterin-binding subunit [Thermodesulfobacteriota bacterium]
MKRKILGQRLPRIDAVPKATGAAQYTVDLKMPGMLYGRILRSPLAHARIKRIDVSRAAALPGVVAVLTAKDCPPTKFSFMQFLADKTILCTDKVRYVGDEVAAVAAVDALTAEEALDLIEVEYEELPAVFDAFEAMKPDAPQVHEGKSNIGFLVERNFGDIEKAFQECDHVVEGWYHTTQVAHCCMEVHNCVVHWDARGRVTVWTNTQAPHTQRQEVARVLGLPLGNVRIINSHMGGGFGSKLVMDMKLPIAALLSKKAGRPVKIQNTREEEFTTAKTRYGYHMFIKTGAKKDGKLHARYAKVVGDNGAYHDKGPATLNFSSMMFTTLYNIPHVRYEGRLVYTNKQMGTAFRGFGNPQLTFATEVQLDELAEEMGLDPLELRLRNCNFSGEILQCGAAVPTCGLKECMETAARNIGWGEKRNQKGLRGVGLANMVHTGQGGRYYGYNATDSYLKMSDDGMFTLVTPGLEMGQGIHTVAAMIVAEELGIGLDRIRVLSNDTDLTPYDLGSWGSRATFVVGNAALAAAGNLKEMIVDVAAQMMDIKPEFVRLENGLAIASGPGFPDRSVPLEKVAEYAINVRKAPLSTEGQWADEIPADWDIKSEFVKNVRCFVFATQAFEVEVDEETGEVKVLQAVASHETGTTINEMMAEGQIEGSVMQGIGYALMENLSLEKGRVVNDGFIDYKIPTFGEQLPIEVELIETGDPHGPFGAKGIGEAGLVPTAAALANAIHHATGLRVRELPITREFLQKALRERKTGG